MNELLGIQIPEDLSALTPDDLSTFISDLKGAIVTALSGEVTVEVADQAEKADALIAQADTIATERAEAEAALSARREALLSKFSEDDATDEGDEPAATLPALPPEAGAEASGTVFPGWVVGSTPGATRTKRTASSRNSSPGPRKPC